GQPHEGRDEGRGESSAHKGPPGPRSVVGTRCEIRNQCRNGGAAILERGRMSSYRRLSMSESPPCPPKGAAIAGQEPGGVRSPYDEDVSAVNQFVKRGRVW